MYALRVLPQVCYMLYLNPKSTPNSTSGYDRHSPIMGGSHAGLGDTLIHTTPSPLTSKGHSAHRAVTSGRCVTPVTTHYVSLIESVRKGMS